MLRHPINCTFSIQLTKTVPKLTNIFSNISQYNHTFYGSSMSEIINQTIKIENRCPASATEQYMYESIIVMEKLKM
jgi:hypothetical protein